MPLPSRTPALDDPGRRRIACAPTARQLRDPPSTGATRRTLRQTASAWRACAWARSDAHGHGIGPRSPTTRARPRSVPRPAPRDDRRGRRQATTPRLRRPLRHGRGERRKDCSADSAAAAPRALPTTWLGPEQANVPRVHRHRRLVRPDRCTARGRRRRPCAIVPGLPDCWAASRSVGINGALPAWGINSCLLRRRLASAGAFGRKRSSGRRRPIRLRDHDLCDPTRYSGDDAARLLGVARCGSHMRYHVAEVCVATTRLAPSTTTSRSGSTWTWRCG